MDDGKRVLVTGGHGFIGSRVVQRLCARGYRVRCLVRATSNTARIDGMDVERAIGDVRDELSLNDALRDMEGCLHLASVSSWSEINSPVLEDTVIKGTQCLLQAARTMKAKRVLYVSSAAAINGSSTPRLFDEETPFELYGTGLRYAIAKHHAEEMVLTYAEEGHEAVIVNPVEVYGPEDTGFVTAGNLRDILSDSPSIVCWGGTGVTHVDDVADGIVSAYERGRSGHRYILGGDNLSIEQLARLTIALAGQHKSVLRVPNGLLRWSMRSMARMGFKTPIVPEVLDYATRFFFMSSAKAVREIGYTPRPAPQVIGPVVTWLQGSGYVQ